MAYLGSSSSGRDHRYSQHAMSDDNADRRSNSTSDFADLGVNWSGSRYSYVLVEHGDAYISGESSRAGESASEAQAGLTAQNHRQERPGYQEQQNNLQPDQLDYSQSSTLVYSNQPEPGLPNAANDLNEHWTHRAAAARPYPMPTMDARSSGNDQDLQHFALAAFNDQEPLPTQDGTPYYPQQQYNIEDDIVQAYPMYTQGDSNTAPTLQQPIAGAIDAPWPAGYQQYNRQIHLESHVNLLVDVIQTPGIPYNRSSGGWAFDSDSTSLVNTNGQGWGGASEVTVRSDGARQGCQVNHSNDTRSAFHNGNQDDFPVLPDRAVIQTALGRSLPIQSGSRLTSTRNNRRRSTAASVAPTSSSSAFSAVLQCPSCPAKFEGTYREGNYGRHRRQNHNGPVRSFPCEHGCHDRAFRRKDARLKHYRRHHPNSVRG